MTFTFFSLWTFFLIGRPQDLFSILVPLRPALFLGGLTLASVFFSSPQTLISSLMRTPEARRYLLFFVIMIAGIPFAYHRRVAFDYIFTFYLMNLLFFLVFVTLVDSFEKLKKVVMIISLSMLFYGLFGLLMGSFSEGRFAIYSSMFDPNDVAYVLITIIPFGLFYIIRPEGRLKKLLSWIGVASSLIVILLSGSRSGILGLIAVMLLILMTRIGSLRRQYKIGLIVGMILVAALNHDKINVERYLSFLDLESDYNVTSESGRLEVWKKGIELFMENPLTGVGVRCFPMAIGYLRQEASIKAIWQAAHNSYLQVAVETGLFGAIVFISLIAGAYRNFARCRQIEFNSGSEREKAEFKTLAGLMQLSFIGSMICAFFLSQGYSMFFTLFFSLSAVMRSLSGVPVSGAAQQRHSAYVPAKI